MALSFPVVNPIEESINNQVNLIVSNNDVNLKTIVKMSILNDMNQVNTTEMKEVLLQIEANNKLEKYFIDKEYGLTYDLAGNLIPVHCINEGGESKKDTESIIPESTRSE